VHWGRGKYNHAQYLEQRREALEKWGRYLTGSVGDTGIPVSGSMGIPMDRPLSPHQRNNKEVEVSNQLVSGTRG
jgi:hypothetical protein